MTKQVKKNLFLPHRFYTIFKQKSSNLKQFLSNIFRQGFQISKKFGHWTLGNGSKKTVKQSEQMGRKKSIKTFLTAAVLHHFGLKS